MKTKSQIRAAIKRKLKQMSDEDKAYSSSLITFAISSLPQFMLAKVIAIYYPLPNEVNLLPLVAQYFDSKIFLMPVIAGDSLVFKRYTGIENTISHAPYYIPEPIGDTVFDPQSIDIILVPGMAFDHSLNRMGRGKGFYDRFLPSVDAPKIGVCFQCQILPEIPTNSYDVKMDLIVETRRATSVIVETRRATSVQLQNKN